MNRKNFKYAFLALLAAGLSSCASEDFWDTFDRTIDGPIDFTVGIESSPAQRTKTRATDEYSMANGTQVLLKVDGAWNKLNPATVSKTAICTTSDAALSYVDGQTLYWDDYGAGDPNNSTNTTNGLSVLGVAVDGNTTAPTVNDWTSLPWSTVDENGNAEVNTKSKLSKDIIVSNNLTGYKFAERKDDAAKKMTFIHPLSKITFNIKAGVGFPKSGENVVGATTYKFEKDPTLTFNNAITNGTINIEGGTAVAANTTSNVIAGTISTSDDAITVIKQTIVYPGTQLGTSNSDVIAVLNADDNIYRITAEKIYEAIDAIEAHKNSYKTKAGYNYIINITVNKTGIVTMATVTNWTDVNTDEAFPKINVISGVGAASDKPTESFKFALWRSESNDKKYVNSATPTAMTDGSINWTGTNALCWANHSQHLFLRGIYPEGTTVSRQDEDSEQYVSVKNGEYNACSFPSNFLMGMPEVDKDETCGSTNHTPVKMSEYGICAREAAINLNFRYMMSQVEVNLTSTSTDDNAKVDLTNAKVELADVYNTGNILLKDRSAEVIGSVGNHTLNEVDATNHKYRGVIVPQTLSNVKFKITTYDTANNTSSVYYADVASINVTENGKSTTTDAWKSGAHYVYNLNLTKTKIAATATLTDWKIVTASEEVWF